MKQFQQDFFNKPKDIAVAEFKRRVDTFLGPNNVGTKHIEELHDLGYLPIRIKALPEGTKKSLKGLICVQSDGNKYIAEDQVTKEQEDKSCLQTVFEDGKLVKEWSLSQIRANVNNSIVLED